MKVNDGLLRATLVLAVLLLAAGKVQAQSGGSASPAAAPQGSKVGILNLRLAVVNTAEGKLASAELQSQFTARQTELENLRKQIQDLQNRLSTGENTLSLEEKARLTRQGEALARQLQRKQEDFQEDVNAAQGEVTDRLLRKMQEVLDRYARENSYTLILDTSSQNTPVIYASNQVDITQDIIRLYDQANPVKGAPPPRQTPAQPRPPQQQPPGQKPPAQQQKPPQQ